MTSAAERFRDRFHPARVAAGAFASPDDILLFQHIPKTAGMSVGRSLQTAFDRFHGIDWRRPKLSFHEQSAAALAAREAGAGRQVVIGHYRADAVDWWRERGLPVKAAAIIREPVARFVSNYNYNTSAKHPARREFSRRYPTMRAYAEDLPEDFQLRYLIGPDLDFGAGLERLIAEFTFLGVAERLTASLAHLSRSHGLPEMKEHKVNRALPRLFPKKADPEAMEIVRARSQGDLRLFDMVSALYAD